MTNLENSVARALRLSESAVEKLLPEIQRNIEVARAELIRSGVPANSVIESDSLIEAAIITFCLVQMGSEADRDRNEEAFRYQQDNLRKS